jgi:hypothetical protein
MLAYPNNVYDILVNITYRKKPHDGGDHDVASFPLPALCYNLLHRALICVREPEALSLAKFISWHHAFVERKRLGDWMGT